MVFLLRRRPVAMDSIATAYHAVAAGVCVTASMAIAAVCLGGVGMNGVTIAALQGATAYGVDIKALRGHGMRYKPWGLFKRQV
jgi:hypothetical protein